MTMYEVLKASFAYDPRKVKSVEEAFEKYEGYSNAKGVKLCKTIDEAREALADIKVDLCIFDAGRYAEATVAYIEEGDWDWDEDLKEYVFCSGVDRWDFKAAIQQKEENNLPKDIEIISAAKQKHPQFSQMEEGYIIRYDDELYFVYDPDKKLNMDDCRNWVFDIEQKWCFNEIDEGFYKYYTTDGKLINVEDLK